MTVDLFSATRLVLASVFGNLVVVGVTAGLLLAALGSIYLAIDARAAKVHVARGLALACLFSAMAYLSFGSVPTTFGELRALGVWTIPGDWVSSLADALLDFSCNVVAVVGGAMLLIGVVLVLGRSGQGMKVALVGVAMLLLSTVIAGPGLVGIVTGVIDNALG